MTLKRKMSIDDTSTLCFLAQKAHVKNDKLFRQEFTLRGAEHSLKCHHAMQSEEKKVYYSAERRKDLQNEIQNTC